MTRDAAAPTGSARSSIAIGQEVLYLTREDVLHLGISDGDVLDLVRTALIEHGHKRCEMPAKIGLHPLNDTLMHAMPAFVPIAKACGIKWASCFPENVRQGLEQTSGVLVLNDPDTGWPQAIMDATWITARRTPAVSSLACEKLARRDSATLAIIGCGVQGQAHLEFLMDALPGLQDVRVFDVRTSLAEKTAASRHASVDITVARSAEAAIRGADVIVTATAILSKPRPFISHAWIKEGALVLPIDFDSAWEWETLASANKFIVDSIDEMEYFRSIGYLPHGLPKVHAEIGEIVAGIKPGRQADEELIVDMNIGMGVEDMVLAREVFDRAIEAEVGRRLPL